MAILSLHLVLAIALPVGIHLQTIVPHVHPSQTCLLTLFQVDKVPIASTLQVVLGELTFLELAYARLP